jgi:hypothetical protein
MRASPIRFNAIGAAALIGAALALGAGPAEARWPPGYDSPLYFHSTDASLIEATLGQTVFRLPRAAVVFAEHYEPSRMPWLPDKVVTDDLQLVVTYDGKPLSFSAQQLAGEKQISEDAAIEALRLQHFSASLRVVPAGHPWEQHVRAQLARLPIVDRYDGLPHAVGDTYIGQEGVDTFLKIDCYPDGTASHFCTAAMRLSPTLIAYVAFPDFRYHGGRAFANDRLRAFHDVICRYAASGCGHNAVSARDRNNGAMPAERVAVEKPVQH